jgi:hypothetical protein
MLLESNSDEKWRETIEERWPWTREFFLLSKDGISPSELAFEADQRSIKGRDSDCYKSHIANKIWNQNAFKRTSKIVNPYLEYNWMEVFMKLDYEEIIKMNEYPKDISLFDQYFKHSSQEMRGLYMR